MSLRAKLAAFLLVASIVPSIIVISFYSVRISGMLRENSDEYMDRLVSERAMSVNGYFDGVKDVLFNLKTQQSTMEYLKTVTPDNYSETASRLLTSQITEKLEFVQVMYEYLDFIGIFPLNGGLSINRGPYNVETFRQATDPDLISDIAENPHTVRCRTVSVGENGRPALLLYCGIMDRYYEELIAYIVVKINAAEYFDSITESAAQSNVFIVKDGEGSLLYCPQGYSSTDMEIISDGCVQINGKKYTAVGKRLNFTDWELVSLSGTADIDREIRKTTVYTLGIAGLCTLFTVLASGYFYVKIYAPIKALTEMINNQGGDLLHFQAPVSGGDELGRLGSAFNQLIARVNTQVAQIAQNEKQKAELEMQALQAQITPHFLYNTLNAIKCMALLKKTDSIAQMSESLIDLLRVISSKERCVPLRRECEYVRAYCQLMSLRSGHNYELELRLAESTEDIQIPKLSLQPIIENSIIHGLQDGQDSMRIIVTSRREEGSVCIVVSDNGCGASLEKITEINHADYVPNAGPGRFRGIGIDNVRSRLKMQFGENTHVNLSINKTGGTDVTIVFPYE